ncbi:polysaccharide biosynthesis C-terminal domain-containing protein [Planococcus soli]|uniref:polysaccharide biosynthesis C-terminal domain-containing protein n=1 Tax=Planococcus soli TaxID=2666072 RepID=UPI00115F2AE8|nr:NAD-dependent epimerase/dehydratase family protein [Planococcus soli]
MKVLITGAGGFIGKNLVAELKNQGISEVFEYTSKTDSLDFDKYCKEADFIFHLAGVNRPKSQSEYMEGNYGFTNDLINKLKKYNNLCPIVFSSSIQSSLDNAYGLSKKNAEKLLLKYSEDTGAKVIIYRFPNVFGKWCKPNYNSVVATFCNNIINDLPITINDEEKIMKLVYIDDVISELISSLNGKGNLVEDFYEVPEFYTVSLGEVAQLIYSFNRNQKELSIPDFSNEFTKKLYSTYLSYLPKEKLKYPLKMNIDERGSFTEFLKTPDRGQISINISKPQITKGNHWHHSKNEKFLVVSGVGIIRIRKLNSDEIYEYHVNGLKMEVIDIPVGCVHNIENIGVEDMVTVMWANECFDKNNPDTYYMEV